MAEGAEGQQPSREDKLNQKQGEALKKEAEKHASTPPENTESDLEQKTQQEAKLCQENAKGALGKIDALPEKPNLNEKVQQKLDNMKDKYFALNAKVATWLSGAGAVATTGIFGLGTYATYENTAYPSYAKELAELTLNMSNKSTMLTAATVATVYAGSKAFQKFQMWREGRKMIKEAQKEAPKQA